jgi:membrane protein DedA with SNARE-associated domain
MATDPLSALVSSVATWGYAGLLVVVLLERLVPVLPSYGLLVAIGIAAAAGVWSFPAAIALSTVGGLAGCLAFYGAAAALGEARSDVVVRWTSRLAGLSTTTMARLTAGFHRHQGALAFGSQLVPTVRLVAPAVAGLLRARMRRFAVASACGIALWNAIFITIGYVAALAADTTNVPLLAMFILAVLLVGEGLALALWRRKRARQAISAEEE